MINTTISLYLHIPFCVSKCHYCDFYSIKADQSDIKHYLDAVLSELDQQIAQYQLNQYHVSTIFFGGGTPSILSPENVMYICKGIRKRLLISDNAEWTFECNPDSFSIPFAETLLSCGVNRLSFGIQSLADKELITLGRIHSAKQALDTLHSDILSGFTSINADVMYGIPYQTESSFANTLTMLSNIPVVRHLSVYELTINEHTVFGKQQSSLPLPDDDAIDNMTTSLFSFLKEKGFDHYEVSNYALAGFRCKHNEAYWNHNNYIGLGTSAHSFFNHTRWSNISDVSMYINNQNKHLSTIDFSENIDKNKIASEMIFLGLRRAHGIDERYYKVLTDCNFVTDSNKDTLDFLIKQGFLQYTTPFWKPTEKGMLFADAIARKLM